MPLIFDPQNTHPALTGTLHQLVGIVTDNASLNWRDLLPEQLNDIAHRVAVLLRAEETDELLESLKAQGLSFDALRKFMTLLEAMEVDVGGAQGTEKIVKLLLSATSSFGEGADWPLVNLPKEENQFAREKMLLKGTFAGNGSASLNASMQVQFLSAVDKLSDKTDSAANMMRYAVIGEVALGGEASFSAPIGSAALTLSAGASASAKGAVEIYSQATAGAPLIRTLYEDLRAFDDIPGLSAFRNGDIDAVCVEYSGNVGAYANVGIGFTHTVRHTALDNVTGAAPVLDLGANYATRIALAGDFDLLAYTEKGSDNKTLIVEAAKSQTRTTVGSFSLSAGLKTPELKNTAKHYLQELTQFHGELQTFIDQFADPGTELKTKLQTAIQNQPSWQENLLALAIGEQDSSKLIDQLTTKLSEVLAGWFVKFDELIESGGLSPRQLRQVAQLSGLPIDTPVLDSLDALITDTLSKWQQHFVEETVKLVENGGTEALAPLERFGTKVDGVADNLNNLTDELLAPLHQFRKQYKARLTLFEDFINNTLVEEIGISYTRTAESIDTQSAVIKLAFDLNDEDNLDNMARYLGLCLAGNFEEALKAATDPGNNAVRHRESLFTEALNNSLKSSFSINLFGFNLANAELFSEEVEIRLNGHGQLSVCRTKADVEKISKAGGEYNKISVANDFNLLNDTDSTLSVNCEFGDRELNATDLRDFLAPFEAGVLSLVPSDTLERAKRVVSTLNDAHLTEDSTLVIQLSLPVPVTRLKAVLNGDLEIAEHTVMLAYCHAISTYFAMFDAGSYARGYRVLEEYNAPQSFEHSVLALLRKSPTQINRRLKDVVDDLGYRDNVLGFARDLVITVNKSGDTMLQYIDEIVRLSSRTLPGSLVDAEKAKVEFANDLRRINWHISELVRASLNSPDDVERVHPFTLGFMKALTSLLALPKGQDQLVTTIYLKTDGQLPIPIIPA